MTEKEYRQHPAISRSELWHLRESPEKFLWYREGEYEPTEALLIGQYVHAFILTPTEVSKQFIVTPKIDRRTTAGKKIYAEFLEKKGDRTAISMETAVHANDMAVKLSHNPLAVSLLKGTHEKEYFWFDDMTGVECKCRVDCIKELGDQLIIIDYKTCQNASTEAFMRDAIRYGYHFQAAMYSAGVAHNTGKTPTFVFIAQEKEPPYAVNILQATPDFVEAGYDIFRELIGIYQYCKATNNWYGYTGRDNIINELDLPKWMKGE